MAHKMAHPFRRAFLPEVGSFVGIVGRDRLNWFPVTYQRRWLTFTLRHLAVGEYAQY
jgi:hypothetical protein